MPPVPHLTRVDDCSRESPGLLVERPELEMLLSRVVWNGPEYTSQQFDKWAHDRGITLQGLRTPFAPLSFSRHVAFGDVGPFIHRVSD
jgi:hypothetical protein